MKTNLQSILPYIVKAKLQQKKIVLVTGVFDLLHSEHLKFLTKAKHQGDLLIVGIETDQCVRKIKGPERPINAQKQRLEGIINTKIADLGFILPEQFNSPDDHERLIKTIKPDILAVSSHTKHLEAKRTILNKYNGVVKVVHQHNPKISTTKLIAITK